MDKAKAYDFTLKEGHRFSGARDRDGLGLMHSFDDEPAVVYADGTKWWYREGQVHRDGDKPAIEWWNGTKEWFFHDKRHREGGPALVYSDHPSLHPRLRGTKHYYTHGQLVRVEK